MSSVHRHEKNKGLEPRIVIDRQLMFYLAANTKTSTLEVATTLMGLSDRSITRMRDHGGEYRTNHFMYPDTKIELTAKATTGTDTSVLKEAGKIWYESLAGQFNINIPFEDVWSGYSINLNWRRLESGRYEEWKQPKGVRDWIKNNPEPNSGELMFKCIDCSIALRNGLGAVTISQQDIDNFLIENILLGGE